MEMLKWQAWFLFDCVVLTVFLNGFMHSCIPIFRECLKVYFKERDEYLRSLAGELKDKLAERGVGSSYN